MEFGRRGIALAMIALLLATPAAAQRVIDGDTIALNGTRYRLWGIDAPESRQSYHDGWPAGVEATHYLEQLMTSGPVQCEDRGHDRYWRTIGLCKVTGQDLGILMVALAWPGRSRGIARTTSARRRRRLAHTSACMRTTARRLGTGGAPSSS